MPDISAQPIQPDEVVKTVSFLLADGASYITGQHLAVSGGFHISL